jgi:uncharacterized protein YkwD
VNRCIALPIALISTLFLALPSALGAPAARRHRANVHIRHHTIHQAPRKGRKRTCAAHKTRKALKHAKHGSCLHHKKAARHAHKRATHYKRTTHRRRATHKRPANHKRKRPVVHGVRPATASRECPGANLTPRSENIESVVAATICLVNVERARFGEPALIEDSRLASAAAGHSRDMDARHYFEHVSPGGQTPLMRLQASGFIPSGHAAYTLGENIAWGTLWLGTPRAIVKAWMASPGHRANILNRSFRYTGVGIDSNLARSMSGGQAGGMYTQDFGTILG